MVTHLEERTGKSWKVVCRNVVVYVNGVKGELWLLVWKDKWRHAVILERGTVSMLAYGGVTWTNNDKVYKLDLYEGSIELVEAVRKYFDGEKFHL